MTEEEERNLKKDGDEKPHTKKKKLVRAGLPVLYQGSRYHVGIIRR